MASRPVDFKADSREAQHVADSQVAACDPRALYHDPYHLPPHHRCQNTQHANMVAHHWPMPIQDHYTSSSHKLTSPTECCRTTSFPAPPQCTTMYEHVGCTAASQHTSCEAVGAGACLQGAVGVVACPPAAVPSHSVVEVGAAWACLACVLQSVVERAPLGLVA